MSLNLYPNLDEHATRDIGTSDIDDICNAIHDAVKGFGTNEKYVFFFVPFAISYICTFSFPYVKRSNLIDFVTFFPIFVFLF